MRQGAQSFSRFATFVGASVATPDSTSRRRPPRTAQPRPRRSRATRSRDRLARAGALESPARSRDADRDVGTTVGLEVLRGLRSEGPDGARAVGGDDLIAVRDSAAAHRTGADATAATAIRSSAARVASRVDRPVRAGSPAGGDVVLIQVERPRSAPGTAPRTSRPRSRPPRPRRFPPPLRDNMLHDREAEPRSQETPALGRSGGSARRNGPARHDRRRLRRRAQRGPRSRRQTPVGVNVAPDLRQRIAFSARFRAGPSVAAWSRARVRSSR